jgi:hypothetical protein
VGQTSSTLPAATLLPLPALCQSEDTVSAGVWPDLSSPHLVRFVLLQFHGDWDSYLLFGLWADAQMMGNPYVIICIEEWITSLSNNDGGKPAAAKDHVTHEDDVSSHRGFCWGEDRDPSINGWNKTLSVDPLMSQTSAGTPSLSRQLFLGTPSPASRKPTEATIVMEVDIELHASEDAKKAELHWGWIWIFWCLQLSCWMVWSPSFAPTNTHTHKTRTTEKYFEFRGTRININK